MTRSALFGAGLTLALALATPAPAAPQSDVDADGVVDALDNCPVVYNPSQDDGDLPPAEVYDFDTALGADGNPAPSGQYLNDGVFLGPDQQARFERRGRTWTLIDGSGVLRMERDTWGWYALDHCMFLFHQEPLPEHYVLSVDDLWRTYPYTGVTVNLAVVGSPSGPPDLLGMMSGLNRFLIKPDMYWWGNKLDVFVEYQAPNGVVYRWRNDHWAPGPYLSHAIPSGFHPDLDVRYEIVKDESGYRARVLRLDTGEVVLETTPVPADALKGSHLPGYAVLGSYAHWLALPYVMELDNWTIRSASDGGDVCDVCPAAYDPDQLDLDSDGVGDACDRCPTEMPDFDADRDGCTDRAEDLAALVLSLDLPPGAEEPLLASIAAAQASIARGNERSAANQLRALVRKVEAQRGKKIPAADADMLVAYVENVIASILA